MNGLVTVTHFLLTSIFSFVIMILWLRLSLRYFRISSLQPVAQLVYRLTAKPFKWLNTVSPFSPNSRYDWLTFTVLVTVELIKFISLSLLLYQQIFPLPYLFIFILADLIVIPCNFLFYLIIFRVLMSWLNPFWTHPIYEVIKTITNPLLTLGRKIITPIAGIDFSPFIILMILKAVSLFISASLPLHLI